ncbi:MAG TPA: gamma-glutamyl-gamma-aminobutyrate hydrolase family protein [Hyphomicrobium sp.]|nr:gamma-glutamyl-gamma-aminobutyrate hydrolase family protein [Hyphomicrobium sp.]
MSRPLVIIPACTKDIGGLDFDAVGRKYTAAVAEVAQCQPLLVPVGPGLSDIGALLDIADGIMLTGSLSNVEPVHYGTEKMLRPETLDRARDAITLPLARAAVEKKVPLFAICRGFQELNVALGGTLHQAVHDADGLMDHREREGVDMNEKFGPVHPLSLKGQLRDWVGEDEIMVNSLHGQGVKKLSDKLVAEAFAKDGLVEGVRYAGDHPFYLGVQWHPEWQAKSNPVSVSLFRRFGAAAGVK